MFRIVQYNELGFWRAWFFAATTTHSGLSLDLAAANELSSALKTMRIWVDFWLSEDMTWEYHLGKLRFPIVGNTWNHENHIFYCTLYGYIVHIYVIAQPRQQRVLINTEPLIKCSAPNYLLSRFRILVENLLSVSLTYAHANYINQRKWI